MKMKINIQRKGKPDCKCDLVQKELHLQWRNYQLAGFRPGPIIFTNIQTNPMPEPGTDSPSHVTRLISSSIYSVSSPVKLNLAAKISQSPLNLHINP